MKQLKQYIDRSVTQRLSLAGGKLTGGKLLTILALAAAALALVSALLSLGNSARERRLLREQARTLPVLRRAAQRYLDEADARDGAPEESEDLPF